MAVPLEHDSEDTGSPADSHDSPRSEPADGAWGEPEPARAPAASGAARGGVDGLFGLPVTHPAPGGRAAAGPAPAPAGDADDPIASLFQGGRALPAPAIPEAPSESELKRWNATVRSSSLFDESVVDPPPNAGARSGARARGAAAQSGVGVRTLPSTVIGRDAAPLQTHEPEFDAPIAAPVPPPAPAAPVVRKTAPLGTAVPMPLPAAAAAVAAPAAPAAPARKAKKDSASRRSGMRNKRAETESAELPEASEEARSAAAAPVDMSRKRRIARGPNKIVLAGVGLAALLSIGTAAAVVGLIPSPIPFGFTGDPNATAPAPATAKPAAEPVAARAVAAQAKPATLVAAAPAAHAAPAAPAQAPKAQAAAKPAPAQPAPAPKAAAAAAQSASDDGTTLAPDADRLILAANKKLAADDAAGAEALVREGLARDPDDHHLIEVLVRALIEQDRGAEAVPLARKIVKKRGKRVPYRLLLGDALLMVGDQAGARAEWQAAFALDPKDRQVRMRLGM